MHDPIHSSLHALFTGRWAEYKKKKSSENADMERRRAHRRAPEDEERTRIPTRQVYFLEDEEEDEGLPWPVRLADRLNREEEARRPPGAPRRPILNRRVIYIEHELEPSVFAYEPRLLEKPAERSSNRASRMAEGARRIFQRRQEPETPAPATQPHQTNPAAADGRDRRRLEPVVVPRPVVQGEHEPARIHDPTPPAPPRADLAQDLLIRLRPEIRPSEGSRNVFRSGYIPLSMYEPATIQAPPSAPAAELPPIRPGRAPGQSPRQAFQPNPRLPSISEQRTVDPPSRPQQPPAVAATASRQRPEAGPSSQVFQLNYIPPSIYQPGTPGATVRPQQTETGASAGGERAAAEPQGRRAGETWDWNNIQ